MQGQEGLPLRHSTCFSYQDAPSNTDFRESSQ